MDLQRHVQGFLAQHGLRHTPQVHALDLVSEVGELAKALLVNSDHGRSPLMPDAALQEELGDAFFSLIALSEGLSIDLTQALGAAMRKYEAQLASQGHSGSDPQNTPTSELCGSPK
jgi:NTP pyrophosphatase (non-canonical NTP hydrolase)